MKWCRIQVDSKAVYGIVEGNQIIEVQGTPFGRYRRTSRTHTLKSAKFMTPVTPPTVYASGVANYRDHVKWASSYFKRPAGPLPTTADIGYRAVSALLPHGQPIIIPKDASDDIHYENELVVVIGKTAKHLSRENALSCVLGYTIGNDMSERTWQATDKTFWRSKNTDTFKPMGPWIETDFDLSKATSITRINGKEVSRFVTGKFLFDIEYYISEITRYVTLHPGDVIWMGTDGATLPPLKHGDVVECEITGIGVLRNPVKRED
jgi:2-keto-4-pentenoate hydratase/2-oxohepta-3-ene-1,7-dioic acid hydratase in catechol pathway